MKPILSMLLLCGCFVARAQTGSRFGTQAYDKLYEAKYMPKPPVFVAGRDSLRHYYFDHFGAFDTVLTQAVNHGDTAKYLRVYFSFNIDPDGIPYDVKWERVASTRSPVTESALTLGYFNEMKPVLQQAVIRLFNKMPSWRPGLHNGVPVHTHCEDFLQFWVGLTPPQ